jgi:thiol-disulfide isomerase/thioredoxin
MLSVNLGPIAVQVSHLLLLVSMLVAAMVGHRVGRAQSIGIGNVLLDMTWVALLVGRVVFVALWFDQYRAVPWSILDIRDGGFTPWAGVAAALVLAIWRASKHPPLRRPLSLGLIAGALTWTMSGGPGLWSIDGQMALPTVELKTLAGKSLKLADLSQGKPMVVNLWATWCPPCRREMPVLAQAQQRETEVTIAFADQGEGADKVAQYLRSSQLKLDHVLLDASSQLGQAIGSSALPTTLFYDASGRLVDTHVGALSAATLAAKLAVLRQAPVARGRWGE